MRTQLFQQEFKINPSAHQAHLIYRVYVPENLAELEIQFQYGPIVEKNQQMIRNAVIREGLLETIIDENTTVRNLLTVSVNERQNFRGAHHFFSENQNIRISEEHATEGFIPGKINEGHWEFIISCHGVFSEEVNGRIEVIGISNMEQQQREEVIPFRGLLIEPIKKDRDRKAQHERFHIKRVELHSHTNHSDAPQTTEELLTQAEKENIDWLAITDHNTVTAFLEAERENHFHRKIKLQSGIEYTTFYGHFLVHGPIKDILVDWTLFSKDNMNEYLEKLKEKKVYITIAHPYDTGNPFCTGCRWEYMLENLKFVDAIEVWNGTNPQRSLSNEDAFYQWTRLLKQGYEISASSGRDWHRLYPDEAIAYTYILLREDETEEERLEALKLGRTYISIRPQIDFTINEFYILGDRVKDSTDELHASILLNQLKGGDQLRLYSQHDLIFEKAFTDEMQWEENISIQNDGYSLLRVEVWNKENERIAFTNPIYIG